MAAGRGEPLEKVVVTGAAGFIGSHLVDRLLADGKTVVGVDDLQRGRVANLEAAIRSDRFRWVPGDIRDARSYVRELDDASVVFHLAAISTVALARADPATTFEVNVQATSQLLRLCDELAVPRVVLASSREVYGNPRTLPAAESSPIEPLNVYGQSKARMEDAARRFASAGGRRTTVSMLRLANVYGTRDVQRVLPRFVDSARKRAPLIVIGSQARSLDLVHVDDVVQAFLRAAERAPREPINVGSGERVTLGEIVAMFLEERPGLEVQVAPRNDFEVDRYQADVRALRERLGITPRPPRSALRKHIKAELAA